jgi:formate-dependent nitrite reductase cytochrome c552 subunit
VEYKRSQHYQLWVDEQSGKGEVGSGVSCANCHMPHIKQNSHLIVQHNIDDNLRPNHKMLDVCLQCHGLPFSLDALSDSLLVKHNFTSRPTVPWKGWALLDQSK